MQGLFLTPFILTHFFGKNANKTDISLGIYLVTMHSYAGRGLYKGTNR
jgi:hypothetical protein